MYNLNCNSVEEIDATNLIARDRRRRIASGALMVFSILAAMYIVLALLGLYAIFAILIGALTFLPSPIFTILDKYSISAKGITYTRCGLRRTILLNSGHKLHANSNRNYVSLLNRFGVEKVRLYTSDVPSLRSQLEKLFSQIKGKQSIIGETTRATDKTQVQATKV